MLVAMLNKALKTEEEYCNMSAANLQLIYYPLMQLQSSILTVPLILLLHEMRKHFYNSLGQERI